MAIVIGAVLYGPVTFAVVFGFIMLVAVWEYLNITLGKGLHNGLLLTKALTMVASVALFVNLLLVVAYDADPWYLLFTFLPLMVIFIANLYVKNYNVHELEPEGERRARVPNGYELFPFSIAAVVYIALPFSIMILSLFNAAGNYDGKLFLSMLVMLWAADVGAYCFGSTLGQKFNHRLFVSISPKKSWEGFWGGLLSAVVASLIMKYTGMLQLDISDAIAMGVIISVFGTFGDLVESQLKRNFGVKDSGSIMPGHGGMLDRFDGALIAFPVAILYLVFFA